MTSLGFPGLSSQSVSGFPSPFRPKNRETDWDDTPGVPGLVIPVRFRVFPAFFGQKTPKRTGMTRLGSPGLFRGFRGPFRPKNPEMDWDDTPGLPRLVIPVRFWVFPALFVVVVVVVVEVLVEVFVVESWM